MKIYSFLLNYKIKKNNTQGFILFKLIIFCSDIMSIMKYKWLNKNNNINLILFFNVWGMDEAVVKNLSFSEYDVVMFYDYNSLVCNMNFLDEYKEKYLIAWSMGVMIASLFNIDYLSKTAINGTLQPIDNEYGIPKKIYDMTIKSFSPKGCEKFIKNMYKESVDLPVIKREFQNQKNELIAIKNYEGNIDYKYDKIIIGSDDKIIPTKNQIAFWGTKPNINSGHAPFYLFNNWSDLL